ncbi:hypothetical protein ACFLT8_02615 [Chloroflexota bacterium]
MDRSRRVTILATSIPPTLFAIVSIVLALLNPELSETEGLNIVDNCLQVSGGLLAVAIISSIVFAIRRKWEIVRGNIVGLGMGLFIWVVAFILVSSKFFTV